MALFYGIGHSAPSFSNLNIVATNCTVVNLTPSDNAKTPSLAEPWRVEITATGASPFITIAGLNTPSIPAQSRRLCGLLGVRLVSFGAPTVWLGNNTFPSVFQVPLRADVASLLPGPYGNFAMTLNTTVTALRVTIEAATVVTLDIGRYWLSDLARVSGGPFEEWTDGGADSGRMVETDGFQGLGYALATRNEFEVPLSFMTEAETYAGAGSGVTGYSSIKSMALSAGTHDQILAGSFNEFATGAFSATSTPYGVDALTYGRLAEVPKIQRVGGPNYSTNLTILELK